MDAALAMTETELNPRPTAKKKQFYVCLADMRGVLQKHKLSCLAQPDLSPQRSALEKGLAPHLDILHKRLWRC